MQNCGGESVDLESDESGCIWMSCQVLSTEESAVMASLMPTAAALVMYAGRSHDVPGGHRVIELVWNHSSKRFDLMPTVDVKTVTFDNTKYPLSTLPVSGSAADTFDDFIDMFDPRSEKIDVYEVYRLIAHRLRSQYLALDTSRLSTLVHWKGCPQNDSTWEPESNLTSVVLRNSSQVSERYTSPKCIMSPVLIMTTWLLMK